MTGGKAEATQIIPRDSQEIQFWQKLYFINFYV